MEYIIGYVIILCVALFLGPAALYSGLRKKHFKDLTASFSEAQVGGFFTVHLTGLYNEKKFRLEMPLGGGRESRAPFRIRLFTDTPRVFTLKEEGFHPSRERQVEIGIPGFDRKYIILSEDPQGMKEYFAIEANRNLVAALFEKGITRIEVKNGQIIVDKPMFTNATAPASSIFQKRGELEPEYLFPVLDRLLLMSKSFCQEISL